MSNSTPEKAQSSGENRWWHATTKYQGLQKRGDDSLKITYIICAVLLALSIFLPAVPLWLGITVAISGPIWNIVDGLVDDDSKRLHVFGDKPNTANALDNEEKDKIRFSERLHALLLDWPLLGLGGLATLGYLIYELVAPGASGAAAITAGTVPLALDIMLGPVACGVFAITMFWLARNSWNKLSQLQEIKRSTLLRESKPSTANNGQDHSEESDNSILEQKFNALSKLHGIPGLDGICENGVDKLVVRKAVNTAIWKARVDFAAWFCAGMGALGFAVIPALTLASVAFPPVLAFIALGFVLTSATIKLGQLIYKHGFEKAVDTPIAGQDGKKPPAVDPCPAARQPLDQSVHPMQGPPGTPQQAANDYERARDQSGATEVFHSELNKKTAEAEAASPGGAGRGMIVEVAKPW